MSFKSVLHILPDHTVTVKLSPLLHCTAVAVRSDQRGAPAETASGGTDRPVAHLPAQTRRAGAAPRIYTLSVTPEYPSKTAGAGPVPSTRSCLPPCDQSLKNHNTSPSVNANCSVRVHSRLQLLQQQLQQRFHGERGRR